MTLRIGSLFSGIGGLELGLEWAGVGETVWQVENNPFCREVLEKYWPGVARYHDVTTFDPDGIEAPVNLICGGFPCQDISSAGKGAGLAGSRSGLWFEFARIVGLVRPSWVVVENVASGASRWVYDVCAGLAKLDYETLPVPLSAQDVGAPHLRRRIFVIGYSNGDGQPAQPLDEEMARMSSDSGSVADTNGPDLRQQSGRGGRKIREGTTLSTFISKDGEVANTKSNRRKAEGQRAEARHYHWGGELRHGIETGRIPEPLIRGVANGVPNRLDRLRALGNSVVPQCAEVIGHMINELRGMHD